MTVLAFLIYSAFCFWVVFLDGADALEGWQSLGVFGWFAASLTVQEFRFYVAISWFASLVIGAFTTFGGA